MPTLYMEQIEVEVGKTFLGLPPRTAGETVTIGAASARTTQAFAPTTTLFRITADVACQWVTGDSAVVADGNSRYLPADQPQEHQIPAGHTHLAVIEQQ